jgi:hypothetical protein
MNKRTKKSPWRQPVDAKSGKPYTAMTTEELREATRQFDEPMAAERLSRPLTAAERAEYRRSVRPRGAKSGDGAKRVLITVERRLLRQVDALAERQGISRSELIARGLQQLVSSAA